MKKLLLFTLLLAFIVSVSYSQTEKQNIIKIFPTSVFFGKTTIGYERVINENGSFTFNLGLPTGVNPLKYSSDINSEDFNLLDSKLNGLLIMPGYRFNFSKKGAPLGFYVEPYLKYENFKMDISAEFIDDENDIFPGNLDGKYSGFGAGVQMGFQFLISDVVSIEWSFLGFEAKSANANLTYTDLDGGVDIDDVYNDLESNFSDIPVIGDSIEFEKGSDFVKVKASNLFLPGLRSAISIGIAF